MTRFMNIFASVALAASLAPVAASATIMTSWSHLQIEPHKAFAGPVPMAARIAGDCDASQAQLEKRTIVYSGTITQMFPVSDGG
jgi:hypothetical protein